MATNEPGHPQANALDCAVADLLDLSLLANHARWNIVGPQFLAVRRLLDEVAELGRNSADRVAERAATLGHAPDGRAASISARSLLPTIAPGELRDDVAVVVFVDLLDAAAGRVHTATEAFETDPVTLEVFTAIVAPIEKYAWMLRAQTDG